MKKNSTKILLLGLGLSLIYGEKLDVPSTQDINIAAGFGVDIKNLNDDNAEYIIPFSVYEFKQSVGKRGGIFTSDTKNVAESTEASSRLLNGLGRNIGETRESRQLTSNKNLLSGIQKILIFSEEKAAFGILDVVNTDFINAKINDRSIVAVCKGKAEDLLKYKINGYQSSADYVEGIIKHATRYNFMAKEYNLLNVYIKMDSEGKNVVLPYIELRDKDITLSGMSIFQGERMVHIIPMEDARIMNILRENNVNGILKWQENSKKYVDYDAKVKRKIKCEKRNGKYYFDINLVFTGDVIENTIFKEVTPKTKNEIERLIEREVEKRADTFISKMQNTYKMDLLELGMNAAARYGRETGVDWNQAVSNAEIKVKAKVKVDKIGVGQYGT